MLPLLEATSTKLRNLTELNVIVGRNGSGKSTFLRALVAPTTPNCKVRYISPERTGSFEIEAGVANNLRQNPEFLENTRRKNQPDAFKRGSAVRLGDLSTRFLRRMQRNEGGLRVDLNKTFTTVQLAQLNAMLANVYIEEGDRDFTVRTVDRDEAVQPTELSSGESEVLALGTEVLHFLETCESDKANILFLDEPDVHLHPDLQARFARFLIKCFDDLPERLKGRVYIVLATHSMPLVAQCATFSGCSFATKTFQSTDLTLSPANDQFKKLAPFFGHPLSLVIGNEMPLIIEGEDDERIWQQAGRSADVRLKVFPTVARTVDEQTQVERECARFLSAIYDSPRAISIRDGDGRRDALGPIGCVSRFRLQCYAAENLLLTDEVLAVMNTTWPEFQTKADEWLEENAGHKSSEMLAALRASVDRFRHTKIKEIRVLIPDVCRVRKPWEVAIGQAISSIHSVDNAADTSLVSYIGIDAVRALGLIG